MRKVTTDLARTVFVGVLACISQLVPAQVFPSRPMVLISNDSPGIGALGTERLAAFPGVPTISEAGFPGYGATNSAGILAPAKTPAQTLQVLFDALAKTFRTPDLRDWMVDQGVVPVEIGSDEYRKILQSDFAKWTSVVAKTGVKIN